MSFTVESVFLLPGLKAHIIKPRKLVTGLGTDVSY